MTITPDMKKAFRVVFDLIAETPDIPDNPDDYADYFSELTWRMVTIAGDNKGNQLMRKLLVGVYEYLAEESLKKKRA